MGLEARLDLRPEPRSDTNVAVAAIAEDWLVDPDVPAGATLGWTTSPFAIRLPSIAWDASCSICEQDFPARGPTGFRGPEPVCDHCLLVQEPQLGMVLALVAVARMHAEVVPRTAAEELAVQAELLAFARIYDRYASKLGPRRPVVDRARRESTDG